MMTGTPCNFLSSQDGKVNTSKILFALAIESNLVEERLGKMSMVQTKKIILKECYSTIIVCLLTCLFIQFEVQSGKVNTSKILIALAIESNLVLERLGKMTMVQGHDNNIIGVLFNIIVCLLIYLFVQFKVQDGRINSQYVKNPFCSCH